MYRLGENANLLICQKSKIEDWIQHFKENYPLEYDIYDLTDKKQFEIFRNLHFVSPKLGIINYELAFRRPDLLKLVNFTLMLDESSLICNEHAKRTRFILKMKPKNVILLSGTPTSGKYERLFSQCRLLGWNITKTAYWNSYVRWHMEDYGGFRRISVDGYKNVEHLKGKLAEHGCIFLKTSEVLDLPDQIEQEIFFEPSRMYKTFRKTKYIIAPDGLELTGDSILTQMLHERQLCGAYSREKLEAFEDLLDSTEDNLVVFYNFNIELEALLKLCEEHGRHPGVVNGQKKDRPEGHDILFCQYYAAAYGLNLQGFSNKIIYFTLPLGKGSCDMWEQSKKRIHRIGQKQTCIYYYLLVRNSIEIWNMQ